jgi:MYXO-CTERM domain-containing protein
MVDPAWTTTGAMAFARTRHELHALPSGRALTFGGTDDNGALASAEVFDPGSETWAMVGGLTTSRYHYASVTLASGEVLVAGGLNDTDGSLASAELYDPVSGKFSVLPAMHAARAFLTATLLADGRVLIAGGCIYDFSTDNCDPTKGPAEIFDPTTKSFTQVGSLQQPRHAHHAARLKDNSVLIVSGTDGTFLLDSTESFDPQTQQFKAGKPVLQARTFGAMGALSDGVIVSTGGLSLDSNPILDSCEYLDPQGAGWFSCPSFNPPRYGHRSLLLPDGQFLLLGGTSALGEISVGEQISSELDSMWIEGAETKLKGARAYLAAVVLGTGQALVSGGMADMTALKSTELFGKGVAGLSCVSNGECTSQHCIDGFCCDTACNAPCLGCSAKVKGQGPNGVCGPVVAGTDPHGGCPDYPVTLCAESGACDGQGACALYPAGTACATPSCLAGVRTTASCASKNTCLPEQHPCAPYACGPDGQNCGSSCAGDEGCDEKAFCEGGACVKRAPSGQPCTAGHACLSGFCADGVCCDSACLGQCESCGVAPNVGACSPQAPGSAPAAGKPACAGDGACGGHCDGVSRAACTYPGPLTTCAASCSGGRETQDRCDGLGHCSSQPTRDCAPYACGPDACLTSCAADTDCTVGYTCMDKACIPRSAARCLGDHTLQGPDGSIRDCSPYRCSAEGACLQACDTTLDCATGQTCRSDRSCRPDIAPPAPADAGCGCRLAPPGRSAPPALALGLVALVALARRRRVCSAR